MNDEAGELNPDNKMGTWIHDCVAKIILNLQKFLTYIKNTQIL